MCIERYFFFITLCNDDDDGSGGSSMLPYVRRAVNACSVKSVKTSPTHMLMPFNEFHLIAMHYTRLVQFVG